VKQLDTRGQQVNGIDAWETLSDGIPRSYGNYCMGIKIARGWGERGLNVYPRFLSQPNVHGACDHLRWTSKSAG